MLKKKLFKFQELSEIFKTLKTFQNSLKKNFKISKSDQSVYFN